MPWLRYFVFMGGALLALLFGADAFSPKETAANAQVAAEAERPTLRIRSDQKWPERIVIDTSQPTVSPLPAPVTATAPAPKAVADVDTTTASLEAFAQVRPVGAKKSQPQVQKRKVAKIQRHRAVASAQQNPLDFFAWR
jgi:hypothetical protein